MWACPDIPQPKEIRGKEKRWQHPGWCTAKEPVLHKEGIQIKFHTRRTEICIYKHLKASEEYSDMLARRALISGNI